MCAKKMKSEPSDLRRETLAIALGRGVEAAARLTFAEAKSLLERCDTLYGTVSTEADIEWTTWRVEPIQELADDGRPSIELAIRAYDTNCEMRVYLYASDSFLPLN